MRTVTRFAPSPTGYLHLGHARSALEGWTVAYERGGRFLLRIEDIDPTRARPAFIEAIFEDLAWLGLDWERPVRRQSAHMDDYARALGHLDALGLVYPCFCTRAEIAAEIARAGYAPHGDEPVYPGTCRTLPPTVARARVDAGARYALRLDMARAAARAGPLSWTDEIGGTVAANPERFGDVVLARKEVPTSYHLSVVVDDHLQGVTLVTRGMDLFGQTDIHRLLQALLRYPAPIYRHHPLVLDREGRRLAKRDGAPTLRQLRRDGATPEAVRAMALAAGAGEPGATASDPAPEPHSPDPPDR